MHKALTPAQRTRLVGILSRLGSDFDGERAAAGLLATRMLATAGITWSDLLAGHSASAPEVSFRKPANDDLRLALRHLEWLTAWERAFVQGLATSARRTAKQTLILREIVAALRGRGFS